MSQQAGDAGNSSKAHSADKTPVSTAGTPAVAKAGTSTGQNFAPMPAPVQAKAPAGVPVGGALEKNAGPSAVLPQPKTASSVPAAASVQAKTSAAPTGAEANGSRTYTVKRGDNPWSIAKSQGVAYDELLKLNGLEDPKKLQLNQVLKLPPKKMSN